MPGHAAMPLLHPCVTKEEHTLFLLRRFILPAALLICLVLAAALFVLAAAPEETPLFSDFSLCLSRACLGKMIHFICKWRKQWRFLTKGA